VRPVGEYKAKHMPLARADLESLLRDRHLDRTLTTTRPSGASPETGRAKDGKYDEYAVAPIGITALDARLGGGFPRGQLSEIVGSRSSGRASLVLHALASATARGELVALVDVLDMLDVASADAAGIELRHLLWIRGEAAINPGLSRDRNDRALDRALKAVTLVLQAGNFGLVVFDAAETPASALRRLPFTTWRRLHRIIEGSQTACVLVGDAPIARSAGGVTLKLQRPAASGLRTEGRLFAGLDSDLEVVRARVSRQELQPVRLATECPLL
jgi:RecA DNA recombination protein